MRPPKLINAAKTTKRPSLFDVMYAAAIAPTPFQNFEEEDIDQEEREETSEVSGAHNFTPSPSSVFKRFK
jgi:hypothetical protein